jgi:hypothetical protein
LHPFDFRLHDPAQHSTVINAGFAVALWEKGPQTIHLFSRQPKQVADFQSPRRA